MGAVRIATRTAQLCGCLLLVAAALAGCRKDDETLVQESEQMTAAPTPEAAPTVTTNVAGAQLAGPGGATAVVTFTEEAGGVHVVARVQGAKPGPHGFHVHAGASCDAPDFTTAGDHFNPSNSPHGSPTSPQHHAGDFGNVEVGADGTGNVDLVTAGLSLGTGGPDDVLGKAVILHENPDDLTSQPSGNAGARIACGVVQRAQGQAVTEGGATAEAEAEPAQSPVY
jgi:Cu-Zn family superoxide dismutase